jgi:hypothetical protein
MAMLAAAAVAGDDRQGDRPEPPRPSLVDPSFLESLVIRFVEFYGADPHEIRRRAEAVLATFAGARVQSFVPILVEKRLRDLYRDLSRRAAPETVAGPRP